MSFLVGKPFILYMLSEFVEEQESKVDEEQHAETSNRV